MNNIINQTSFPKKNKGKQHKIFIIMKLSAVFLLIATMQSMATGYGQNVSLNLNMEKTSMREVFKEIERQTELSFIFSDDVATLNEEVSVRVRNKDIKDVLNQLFTDTDLGYQILNEKLIVIAPRVVFQQIVVTGTVTDADGNPVPGVNVVMKGTTQGTITNLNGVFSLSVPNENTILTFSFVGFASKEVLVGTQRVFNVVLEESQTQIEEVVVVAYGVAKKKDLTGSISTIDNKLLAAQPSASTTLTKALEGAIPGVQVSSVDGQPGQDMAIRIRGIGTASQNNSNPLFVVDGVAYSTTDKNIFTTINPQDVESMVVLKDAASGALYGARGANGVIVINTKKGKQGRAVVNFEGKWGVNMAGMAAYVKTLDDNLDQKYEYAWRSIYNSRRYGSSTNWTTNVQNPNCSHDEAALFASQHLFNFSGGTNYTSFSRNQLWNICPWDVPGLDAAGNLTDTGNSSTMNNTFLVGTDGKLNPQAKLLYHDNWRDLFFEKKFRQEYNISISGAGEKVNYYISGSYLQDPSFLLGSKYERYNFRSNVNAQVFDWLKAGVNTSYGRRTMQSPATRGGRNAGDAQENLISWLYEGFPHVPAWAYDKNGNIKTDPKTGEKLTNDRWGAVDSPFGESGLMDNTSTNPLSWKKITSLDKDIRNINDFNATGYLDATFLKNFTARVTFAIDKTFELRDSYRNNETGRYWAEGGALARRQWEYTNLYTLQTITWDRDFGKHHVDALAGHEFTVIQNDRLNYISAQGLIPNFDAFANFIALNTGSGGTWGSNGGAKDIEKLDSYLMRVNYNFDSRYLFTASLRTDGSSKFRYKENRYGVFWSLGAAWRIITEDWAKSLDWLNDLKLRADYGVIGNQNGIDAYSGYQTWNYAATTWNNTGGSMASGWRLSPGDAVNSHLSWEKVHTFDIGLDFRVLNRVSGVVDWYQRQTNDMLWNTPLSTELGQDRMMYNSAAMRTRGIEVDLNVDIITTQDFYWAVNVNATNYKSILTKAPVGMGSAALNGNWVDSVDAWGAAGTGGGQPNYLRGEGKPYYNLYMTEYMGVDQQTGLALYSHIVDETDHHSANNRFMDKKIGELVATTDGSLCTKLEQGDATPKVIGGFGTTLAYKGFDLAIQFAYQIGGKFYSNNYGYMGLYHGERMGQAVSQELWNNTWSPDGANANATYKNTSAKFPMQMYGGNSRFQSGPEPQDSNYSTISLFDASYLSVKNINLGYTLPKKLSNQLFVERVRAFVTLDNMWFFTKVGAIDPRMSITGGFGVGCGAYPYMRNVSFGLNVTF